MYRIEFFSRLTISFIFASRDVKDVWVGLGTKVNALVDVAVIARAKKVESFIFLYLSNVIFWFYVSIVDITNFSVFKNMVCIYGHSDFCCLAGEASQLVIFIPATEKVNRDYLGNFKGTYGIIAGAFFLENTCREVQSILVNGFTLTPQFWVDSSS